MSQKKKIRVGILFGGRSAEHEVSILSAQSVYKALDPAKYDVTMIGIGKDGRWLLPRETKALLATSDVRAVKIPTDATAVTLLPYESENNSVIAVDAGGPSVSKFDVIFPVLHGSYGEDGTMQGLLELANVAYVGSGVLGSAIGMDKEIAKVLFAAAGIPVVPFRTVRKHEFLKHGQKIVEQAAAEFGYPLFVKPANMGSSVGVHKIKNAGEAMAKFSNAFLYDTKVLVEKAIDAREIECSVLGNHEPRASVLGELSSTHEFYSYEAKYVDPDGAKYDIPAKNVPADVEKKMRDFAVRAFTAIECRGLGRVDFFLDKKTNEIYLNEINTIPGFTSISMYPKMWAATGLSYAELIDELIRLAISQHEEKSSLKTSYQGEG